jgi:hypothetical protein
LAWAARGLGGATWCFVMPGMIPVPACRACIIPARHDTANAAPVRTALYLVGDVCEDVTGGFGVAPVTLVPWSSFTVEFGVLGGLRGRMVSSYQSSCLLIPKDFQTLGCSTI